MIMNEIVKTLMKCNNIGITFHLSSDGDSIGSALALMLGLRKLKKIAYIISKEELPKQYDFLPNSNEIDGNTRHPVENTECLVCLDCGKIARLNSYLDFKGNNFMLINLDHHLSNDMYGDLNYVDTKSAAVGEIIYKLLLRLKVCIDNDIASCLYTSIVTDSGAFKYSNTTEITHKIAGKLIDIGINFSEIHRIIYENKNLYRVKLLGKVINNLYLCSNDRLCVMEVTKSMLNSLNISSPDTSDIISTGMEIDSVDVAALFKETDDGIKVSLRSKPDFDVRRIAEMFGGGGHKKASGFSVNLPMAEVKELVIKQIEKELI